LKNNVAGYPSPGSTLKLQKKRGKSDNRGNVPGLTRRGSCFWWQAASRAAPPAGSLPGLQADGGHCARARPPAPCSAPRLSRCWTRGEQASSWGCRAGALGPDSGRYPGGSCGHRNQRNRRGGGCQRRSRPGVRRSCCRGGRADGLQRRDVSNFVSLRLLLIEILLDHRTGERAAKPEFRMLNNIEQDIAEGR
jgi:hypothetical protein